MEMMEDSFCLLAPLLQFGIIFALLIFMIILRLVILTKKVQVHLKYLNLQLKMEGNLLWELMYTRTECIQINAMVEYLAHYIYMLDHK